jgi:4-amino-4-deoxychorismate lyase
VKIEFLETIKVLDGKLCNISYHQQRYERTLYSFGIRDFYSLESILNPPAEGLFRCRVLYSSDGELTQSYYPYIKRDINTLKLVESDIVYDKKYADREELERLFKKREACDEIIIVKEGLLRDTTIANLAFFDGVEWFTPKHALLKGTTRQRLLESGFLKEMDITVTSVKKFEKMALMNAMIDFDIIADKKIEEVIC